MNNVQRRIQVIGIGNLGEAIVIGLIEYAHIAPEDINIVFRSAEHAKSLQDRWPALAAEGIVAGVDTIIAVRPSQVIDLKEDAEIFNGTRIISVAAGVTLETLANIFGPDAKLIRAMPNLSVSNGIGQTALSYSANCSDDDRIWAKQLFGAMGMTVDIEESAIDAFTVFCACGPGILISYLNAISSFVQQQGFDEQTANELLTRMFQGTANWIVENVHQLDHELKQATDLGGPTDALVSALQSNDFEPSVHEALNAAVERIKEMNRNNS